MTTTLRVEMFTDDLDALVDFYTRVLGFNLDRDERSESPGYVALSRDKVYVGAAHRAAIAHIDGRRPPAGTELVLEVDDVQAELAAVQSSGWPIEEGLRERPWGLTDFRIVDPAGYYLRITDRWRFDDTTGRHSVRQGDGASMRRDPGSRATADGQEQDMGGS